MFYMFYAEKIDPETLEIVERGVFYSIAEFIPYRRSGWSATKEKNEEADKQIERLSKLSMAVLRYIAPMACGQMEREELARREQEQAERDNAILLKPQPSAVKCGAYDV